MGFNRRKMDAERKAKADAEAAAPRASDHQVLTDAEAPMAAWNQRQAPANALAVRAHDRRRARIQATTSCGSIARLPHHMRH